MPRGRGEAVSSSSDEELVRLVFVGDEFCGKTSIVNRYMLDFFQSDNATSIDGKYT